VAESALHARKRRETVADRAAAIKALTVIPGIGKSLAADLLQLGYTQVAQLKGEDPQKMYERLCILSGQRQDPCVLYTFRCAVYYASTPDPQPEKLKWWNWKESAAAESPAPRRPQSKPLLRVKAH
jgi:hypothetical protein